MRFSARRPKEDKQTGRRARRLAITAATTAVAGGLALPLLPTAASAATMTPTGANAASATCAATRPHTGTILYHGITGDLSTLTIQNGTSTDGVVMLVLGRSRAIGVYVRAHATTTLQHIKNGNYTLEFTTGSQYHACTGRFARNAAYWRFSGAIGFETTASSYTTDTVTLQLVAGGNAPASQIPASQFPAP